MTTTKNDLCWGYPTTTQSYLLSSARFISNFFVAHKDVLLADFAQQEHLHFYGTVGVDIAKSSTAARLPHLDHGTFAHDLHLEGKTTGAAAASAVVVGVVDL